MKDFRVANFAIHHIDLLTQQVTAASDSTVDSDISAYANELLSRLLGNDRGKYFQFASDDEEAATLISQMMNGDWEGATKKMADRLLRTEVSTQSRLGAFQDIRKGSFLQVKVCIGEIQYIILTKVDHDKYVDEDDAKIHFGLPFEKSAQKTCIFEFNDPTTLVCIKIQDSNRTIAEYWWKGFLCCTPLRTAQENTSKAFKAIDKILKTKVQAKSKADYTYIRNNVITYFRSNEGMVYDEFVESVIESYLPIDDSLSMEPIVKDLRELPKSKGFDTQFEIERSEINARIKRVVVLAQNFELYIKGEVRDLDQLVTTGTDDGREFLKIYSREGYEQFRQIKSPGDG